MHVIPNENILFFVILHASWSQQKAVSYLTDQMCSSFDELLSEVNRYITWPGQVRNFMGVREVFLVTAITK